MFHPLQDKAKWVLNPLLVGVIFAPDDVKELSKQLRERHGRKSEIPSFAFQAKLLRVCFGLDYDAEAPSVEAKDLSSLVIQARFDGRVG